jgi:hypothetical protein
MSAAISRASVPLSSYPLHNLLQPGSIQQLTSEEFRSLEYHPFYGPMIGICRMVYGIALFCFASVAIVFEAIMRYPVWSLSQLEAAGIHSTRGMTASIPVLGGIVLYLWDNF